MPLPMTGTTRSESESSTAARSEAILADAIPLVTSVSLVCAATRHEEMGPILAHAARFALWIVVFMAIVLGVIQLLSWLQ